MTQDVNQSSDALTKIIGNAGKIVTKWVLSVIGLVSYIAGIIYVDSSGFFAEWATIGNNQYFIYTGFIFSFFIYCWSAVVIYKISPIHNDTKITKKAFCMVVLIYLIAFTLALLLFPVLYNNKNSFYYVTFSALEVLFYTSLVYVSLVVFTGEIGAG